jgi:signal transduction histidine kinase/ligand-binding sensor domain-containing protein
MTQTVPLVTSATSLLCLVSLLSALSASAGAERLPATGYTTADGLANNSVYKVVADSRGYIWFATREGLSRFDGYAFTNYGVDDGLPSGIVNDFLETRQGVYLVATAAGLARLETAPRPAADGASPAPLFTLQRISDDPRSHSVTALYQGRNGQLWIGTRAGLFQAQATAPEMTFRRVAIDWESIGPSDHIWCLQEDRFAALWVATSRGLRRLWSDGRIDTHFPDFGGGFHSVLEDRAGHVWAGTRVGGLLDLTLDARSGRLAATRLHTMKNGLPTNWINQLFEPTDGELWAGSGAGLIRLTRATSGSPRIRLFTEANGVGRGMVQAVSADRDGNLWLATENAGATKIARSGLSSFGAADGIAWSVSLMQTRAGDLCFAGPAAARWGLRCFNGVSFDTIQMRFPPDTGSLSWGWNQLMLEDRSGDWWFATMEGVARFRKAARPRDLAGRFPDSWYGKREGLVPPYAFKLFEDSRGDIWLAGVGHGGRNGLSRWRRTTNTWHHFSKDRNLPDLDTHFVTAFAEDGSGNVWMGFSGAGGVARYNQGFDRLDTRGLFRNVVRNIFRDSKGRLWFATHNGLVRADDPARESPTFALYTTKDGFSSNETTAVTEDLHGRLYVGTGRGVDRFEPSTGRIRRYSTRDGFPPGEVHAALLDRRTGHVWFSQQTGVSRLIPQPDPAPIPPPILITGVEVAARAEPLSALGQASVPRLYIEPHRNYLRLEYVALGYGPGEEFRYQYRLEGAPNDWSAPSTQRTVNFANLSPGTYRFLVRAMSADGVPSATPASVEFTIVAPVWQRWWFVSLAIAVASVSTYAGYRYRLARAVEIATMRTRIATDLHDDIGANLTKIAILSEVTRRQLEGNTEAGDRLSTIARISRESVASMSDMVWAINPKRDTLRDTIRRMRQHAEDVFAGRGVPLEFHAPEGDDRLRIPLDVRREFFLIFKEALNNAVRHSECHTLRVDVDVNESGLHLRVADDGVGFDTNTEAAGNGMTSMRRRAEKVGGTLDVISAPGHGTAVLLSVPGAYARRLRHPA